MALCWIATRPGDLDVLELVEREVAPPGPGEVTVAVRAAGLNPADAKHVARGDLADFPRPLGYEVAGVVSAVGPDAEKLFERIRALHAETGQPVTLIGISLGGIMARFAAQRLPGLVREVITVSSPFAGSPRATNVWRAFELITGDRIDSARVTAQGQEAAAPLGVRSTAIWSRSDGLVNGRICRGTGDPLARDIEIASGHLGVQLNPLALRAIAGVLAAA